MTRDYTLTPKTAEEKAEAWGLTSARRRKARVRALLATSLELTARLVRTGHAGKVQEEWLRAVELWVEWYELETDKD